MKNFKRSLALVLAIIMVVGTLASASAFSVGAQAWFADAVYDLQAWGVITESDVDSAMKSEIIDRKTFTLWVAKILSQDCDGKIWEEQVETRYEDVEYAEGSDDNSSAIAYATANGIVRGYNEGPDYQFGPDDSLKLGQAATIVIRLLSRFGGQGVDLYSTTYLKAVQDFVDDFGATEYAAYMWWAQQVNVIDKVYKDNCTDYADGASLTYGEAAYLLWNAATNCKTAVDYDKNGDVGRIAELFNGKNVDINRTYYGIVTDVVINGTDEVAGLTIELQVSSDTYTTLTLTQANTKTAVVDADKKKTDNVGNANSDALYVSVRDFTVGTLVKVSYNGNAANDSVEVVETVTDANGITTTTVSNKLAYDKTKVVSVTKTNSVIVDSFLVYKYGWCGKNGGYKYNHVYNELVYTTVATSQKTNKTPVLPAYYTSDLAITKATATRTVSNTTYTYYTITFKDVTYILAANVDGVAYIASGLKADKADNIIIVNGDTGADVAVADIATVYASIVNTAEGQMKFTFTDTDGDGDYDILTQNKTSVTFDHSTADDLNRAADAINGTYVLFNQNVLRPGETYADEKVVNVSGAAFVNKGAAATGLTALLMNNSAIYTDAANTVYPFYKQVELLDAAGNNFKYLTGVVTDVQTIGDIANYYRITITDVAGTETSVIIPAYNKLSGTATNKRTFTYFVGEDSSTISVDITGWYQFLIDTYENQYAVVAGTANNFPATEDNKPTSLLQKTISVAVDANGNVIAISGKDITTSEVGATGFVTKVEAGANANEFKVTLATAEGTATANVVASLTGAYDWDQKTMLNRLFAQGLLSDTDAEAGAGYVAKANNVLYLTVKNDGGNNYVVKAADETWKNAVISGDITDRIFDAVKTYGAAYTNQTTVKVPTVDAAEVVNYYNAYTTEGYTWTVVDNTEYDANGKVVSYKYSYEKAPAAIYQVKYAQTSSLVVDFTKSYTLQVVFDGGVYATGTTKVLAPFTVYNTEAGKETEVITAPTYAQIYAYQTHKYYTATGDLDTTKGYGLFYTDANGYIGNINSAVTETKYYVDANNVVYTILDYKGLVYETNADGSYVIKTEEAVEVGNKVNVTADALAGKLEGLTVSYITSSLPSNTEYSAHAKNEGYKYVPGWYRLEIKDAETINVKEDTVVVIVTPNETVQNSLSKLDYNYTTTTFGALLANGTELSVLEYSYYVDPNKGYVTYLYVFGGTATVGKNTVIIDRPQETIVDEGKAIVYLPAGSLTNSYILTGDDIYYVASSMQAINIATGEKVGQLKYYYSTWNYGADYVHQAKNDVTIAAGHFYLVDLKNNNAILADLGAVWTSKTVDRGGMVTGMKGFTFVYNGTTKTNYSSSLPSWLSGVDNKTYTVSVMNDTNYNYDTSLLADNTVLGYFGKMTITDVTPTSVIATVGSTTNQDITALNFRFVYFDYEGNNIYEAEAQNVSKALPVSNLDMIYAAEGMTVTEWYDAYRTLYGDSIYGKDTATQNAANLIAKKWTAAPYYASCVSAYNTALTNGSSISDIETARKALEEAEDLYEDFCADYEAVQNDIFWSTDVVNSRLYQYKVQQTTAGNTTITYPTFTYYYDYATQTYTVFVTSFVA